VFTSIRSFIALAGALAKRHQRQLGMLRPLSQAREKKTNNFWGPQR